MYTDDAVLEAIGSLKSDLINLKVDPGNVEFLQSIKSQLNTIFSDSSCTEVIYTNNTDKIFFGINVMPIFKSPQQIIDITMNNINFDIGLYKVEFDSKLFDNYTGLNIDEILSFLVHEVAVLVINDTPARKARYYIDSYLANNDQTIKISDYISYIELLGFGIKEAIRKSISIFSDSKNVPCQLDDALELTRFLQTGMNKLGNIGDLWDKNVNGSYNVIEWTLRLYKDILTYRIPALHTLRRALTLTGSEFDRIEITRLIKRLGTIDDESLIQESAIGTPKRKLYDSIIKEEKYISEFPSMFDMLKTETLACESVVDLQNVLNTTNVLMMHIDNYLESGNADSNMVPILETIYDKSDTIRTTIASKLPELI